MLIGEMAVSVALIESRIHVFRGCRVMLDVDLAALHAVEAKHLTPASQAQR